jgi:hypothetical protein
MSGSGLATPGLATGTSGVSSKPAEHAAVQRTQQEWKEARRFLNQHRLELTQAAVKLYPGVACVGSTLLMTSPAWLPPIPLALDDVQLEWHASASEAALNGREPESEGVRPIRSGEQRFETYADAVARLDRPRLFEDRAAYRLVEVDLAGTGRLGFSHGSYFDVINISEAVALEFAREWLVQRDVARMRLPFRSLIDDPFDLKRRPLPVAISALTLRREIASRSASFVMHWRDPQRVASGGGLYQVMPVGIFQPTSDMSWDEVNDFDLWRSLVREFSEEFLGAPERRGDPGQPLRYDAWSFFKAMSQARRDGVLRVLCFGLGIDPLTLVADILMAVVLDSEAFDELLGAVVTANEEGRVITAGGVDRHGIPFTQESISTFLAGKPMQPAGSAAIALAWQNRGLLLGD